MKQTQNGHNGLSEALANGMAKYRHHATNRDQWTRALRNCMSAQRIRSRRQNRSAGTTDNPRSTPKTWEEAILAALARSRMKITQQLQDGSWERAIKNKLTSIRQRQMTLRSKPK